MTRQSNKLQRAVVLLFVVVMSIRLLSLQGNWLEVTTTEESDDHTIPTLLSVVDHETGRYVYALKNPLYEKLTHGSFLPHNANIDILEPPTLRLNDVDIKMRDPLQLSWTRGRKATGQSVIDDNDVIVLDCDEQIWNQNSGPRRFLDAATIAQARATSRKHFLEWNGNTDAVGDTVWYFPSFPVVRREVCQFSLFKRLPKNTFALVASSQHLQIRNGKSAPTAIHLALGNSANEMVVQFKTGKAGGTPIVKYGIEKDSLLLSAAGTSKTYSAADMCQDPANTEGPGKFQPPGQLHVVRLTHLELNQTYYYRVGVGDDWSNTFSFVSAPETKSEPGPFAYIVYGDQGCPSDGWGQGGAWTAAMTARETNGSSHSLPIRAVHHFGDLSYARGAAHIWDEWLNMNTPFTTRVPLMVAVGNHEYDYGKTGDSRKDPSGVPTPGGYKPKWGNYYKDSGGECGVPTANHFTMPSSSTSNSVFWFSYDYGSVHTTVISSEHDLSPGSIQYEWLENDLKVVDRTRLPWLVLELHRPMYESETDPPNWLVGVEIRHRIEGLLIQYQVDLVLAGHYHSYQRSCAGLYKGKCNNGGPTHLTIGSAGAQLRHGHLMPESKWTKKYIRGVYGYGRVTVANASAMHIEFVKAGGTNDTDAGRVLDEAWLVKDTTMVETVGKAIAKSAVRSKS